MASNPTRYLSTCNTSSLLLKTFSRPHTTRAASTRAHPSPYQSPPKSDPASSPPPKPRPSYKQLERRWLGIMVGTPFVIVSGWTLYKREVLGEDAKALVGAEESEEKAGSDAEGKDGGRGGGGGGVINPKTGRKATMF